MALKISLMSKMALINSAKTLAKVKADTKPKASTIVQNKSNARWPGPKLA